MFRNILENVKGSEVLPVIALILFFSAFLAIIYHLIRMDKRHIRHMEELPLEKDYTNSNNGGKVHG
ncbi:cytochrome C oxidase Cbb3 [bacterium]|nr:MAG: cytochrome C oxidase Cbb3 [bacterium]